MARNKTPQNATENKARTLTPAQIRALNALVAGQSVSKAAQAAEVDRTTVHRWLKEDPQFAAEHNAARLEMAETVQSGIRELADEAIATLRDLMGPNTPANVRLKVVQMVLSRASSGLMVERIGSPLPDEIERDLKKVEFQKGFDIWAS